MKSDSDAIRKIIHGAVAAPSGENTQPWKFVLRGNIVSIINLPDRDNPIYNFRQRGSFFAHGALIENMDLLALGAGYRSSVVSYFDPARKNHVADIQLTGEPVFSLNQDAQSLIQAIPKRASNRRAYHVKELSQYQKAEFEHCARLYSGLVLKIYTSLEERSKIAKAASMVERVMLQSEALHRNFFERVVWTEDEERERRSGLYVKTLELAPPQEFVFRRLKSWKNAGFLAKLGLPAFIAKENARVYRTCSAMFVLVAEDTDRSFLEAGRLCERLWLRAVSLGMSGQALAGLPYLAARIKAGEASMIEPSRQRMLMRAYEALSSLVSLKDNQRIAMILRVGESKAPTAFSSRLEPEIIYETPD
ncbi:MAG: hypothetical protein HYY51_01840 [Candidatus Magasanikbacteria bacterium]|nr:hypothetical protein [Candidatus Magasanikbacteria bacterium]